ncbi:aldehyde dehydrogenase [Domibacillus aminovorans]|uniref:Aldehyde dehydrogenase n=1 Tax=Domibacillus aminovorans TaxID=29332 RepID=A0A177KWX0_9BACI|nr:aldehyde dehydrogenase [Domibacillus aminovorans]
MEMIALNVTNMIQAQKAFFDTEITRSVDWRIARLNELKAAIKAHEDEIMNALYLDLRKNKFEAYTTEIGFLYESIRFMIRHLPQWAAPEKVKTPIHQMPAESLILTEPYGVTLIIGPFNYPFQLVIEPLIGAIAAGNTAIVKPSESTPHTSAVLKSLLEDTFDPSFIGVQAGGKETATELLAAPFDYIFFTGSVPTAKVVMEAAAKQLIPVTLELGGKSPTFVDYSADLKQAAKRIAWGKFSNAGQTCIAPDYVLVHQNVKSAFLKELTLSMFDFYGADPQKSQDFGRIVNEKQFDRLQTILQKTNGKIVQGGGTDRDDVYIEPTIVEAGWDDPLMEDEIFGPILPVLTYSELDQAIKCVKKLPKPLALYVFTKEKAIEEKVITSIPFGGASVNDTLVHVSSPYLPFGGVGTSGMNAYHGKASFEAFSHKKSIMRKSSLLQPNLLYPPYDNRVNLVRKLIQ